jgi:hypothetical protein
VGSKYDNLSDDEDEDVWGAGDDDSGSRASSVAELAAARGTPSDDVQFAGADGADDGPPPAKKLKGRKGYFNWKRGTLITQSVVSMEYKRQYQSRTLHPSLPLRV